MTQIPYIFNQLTSSLPRDYFEHLVAKYNGNAYIKNYTCWNHLMVMVWAHLTSRRSLRDIETSLRVHSDKMYGMGIGTSVSRNNIANSNAKRNLAIYRELAQRMMAIAGRVSVKDCVLSQIADKFKVKGFFAIDSTTVSLPLKDFTWSTPQQGSGGVKLHTMFDVMRSVPRMCMITGHEERDRTFMEDYVYEEGCFYMLDRLYLKMSGLSRVRHAGAFFVTRMKKNMVYEVLSDSSVNGMSVLADRIISFTGRWARKGYPYNLRMISFYSVEKNQTLQFLTNNFSLGADTIALLYKYRWQIELFFKWIKQHLRINNFYGTSGNAVMIQIYTAFISYCLLALAADRLKFKGTLYEFANMMSVSLTEKEWLGNIIKRGEHNDSCRENPPLPSLFDF